MTWDWKVAAVIEGWIIIALTVGFLYGLMRLDAKLKMFEEDSKALQRFRRGENASHLSRRKDGEWRW